MMGRRDLIDLHAAACAARDLAGRERDALAARAAELEAVDLGRRFVAAVARGRMLTAGVCESSVRQP